MYKYKTVIQVKTGQTFDTEKEAQAFICDQVCAEINEILKTKNFRNLTFIDLVEIIKHLAGDVEKIKHLKSIIDKYLDETANDERE